MDFFAAIGLSGAFTALSCFQITAPNIAAAIASHNIKRGGLELGFILGIIQNSGGLGIVE